MSTRAQREELVSKINHDESSRMFDEINDPIEGILTARFGAESDVPDVFYINGTGIESKDDFLNQIKDVSDMFARTNSVPLRGFQSPVAQHIEIVKEALVKVASNDYLKAAESYNMILNRLHICHRNLKSGDSMQMSLAYHYLFNNCLYGRDGESRDFDTQKVDEFGIHSFQEDLVIAMTIGHLAFMIKKHGLDTFEVPLEPVNVLEPANNYLEIIKPVTSVLAKKFPDGEIPDIFFVTSDDFDTQSDLYRNQDVLNYIFDSSDREDLIKGVEEVKDNLSLHPILAKHYLYQDLLDMLDIVVMDCLRSPEDNDASSAYHYLLNNSHFDRHGNPRKLDHHVEHGYHFYSHAHYEFEPGEVRIGSFLSDMATFTGIAFAEHNAEVVYQQQSIVKH